MTNNASDIIAELGRLQHRATDMRAREAQLADAGENDPASDAWKTAAIVAASAEAEFYAAIMEAWPALDRLLREADQWRARESETQEALQAIGEEFGVNGGEPRVDGIRRVLAEKEKALALAGETLVKLDRTNADLNDAALLRGAVDGPKVRPLEWSWEPPYSVARALGGHYAVERWEGARGSDHFDLIGTFLTRHDGFSSLDEAKSAAQADYERRIRSALVLPSPPLSTTKEG